MQEELDDILQYLRISDQWSFERLKGWVDKCRTSAEALSAAVVQRKGDGSTGINITALQSCIFVLDCMWLLCVYVNAPLRAVPAFTKRPSAAKIGWKHARLQRFRESCFPFAAPKTTASHRQYCLNQTIEAIISAVSNCPERSFTKTVLPDAVRALLISETWQRIDAAERVAARHGTDREDSPCQKLRHMLLRCDPGMRSHAAFQALPVGSPSVPQRGRSTHQQRQAFAAARCYGRLAQSVVRWTVSGPGGLGAASLSTLEGLRPDALLKSAEGLAKSVALGGPGVWTKSLGGPPSEFTVDYPSYVASVASQAMVLLSNGSRQSVASGGQDPAAASGAAAAVGSSSASGQESGQEGQGDQTAQILQNDPKFMIASRVALHLMDALAPTPTPSPAGGPAGGRASGDRMASVGLSAAASVRVAMQLILPIAGVRAGLDRDRSMRSRQFKLRLLLAASRCWGNGSRLALKAAVAAWKGSLSSEAHQAPSDAPAPVAISEQLWPLHNTLSVLANHASLHPGAAACLAAAGSAHLLELYVGDHGGQESSLASLESLRRAVRVFLRAGGHVAGEAFVQQCLIAATIACTGTDQTKFDQDDAGSRGIAELYRLTIVRDGVSIPAAAGYQQQAESRSSSSSGMVATVADEAAVILRDTSLIEAGLPGIALGAILKVATDARTHQPESSTGPLLTSSMHPADIGEDVAMQFLVELMGTLGPAAIEGDLVGVVRFAADVLAYTSDAVRRVAVGEGAAGKLGSNIEDSVGASCLPLFLGACELLKGVTNVFGKMLITGTDSDRGNTEQSVGVSSSADSAASKSMPWLQQAVDTLLPLQVKLHAREDAQVSGEGKIGSDEEEAAQGVAATIRELVATTVAGLLSAGAAPTRPIGSHATGVADAGASHSKAEQEQMASEFKAALRQGVGMLVDPSPAMQGGGLQVIADAFRSMSEAEARTLLAPVEGLLGRIVRLACAHLAAEDSYVHLAAVALLEAAARRAPKQMVPLLAKLAMEHDRPIKARTRLFLALIKVAGRAGELLPAYARGVLGACMKAGCGPELPPMDACLWFAASESEDGEVEPSASGVSGVKQPKGAVLQDLAGDSVAVVEGGAALVQAALDPRSSFVAPTGSTAVSRAVLHRLASNSVERDDQPSGEKCVLEAEQPRAVTSAGGAAQGSKVTAGSGSGGEAAAQISAAELRMRVEWQEFRASGLTAAADIVYALTVAGGHAHSVSLLEDCVGGAASVLVGTVSESAAVGTQGRDGSSGRMQGDEGPATGSTEVPRAVRLAESKLRRAAVYLLFRLIEAIPVGRLTESLAALLLRVQRLASTTAEYDKDLVVRGHARSCVGKMQELLSKEVSNLGATRGVRIGIRPKIVELS